MQKTQAQLDHFNKFLLAQQPEDLSPLLDYRRVGAEAGAASLTTACVRDDFVGTLTQATKQIRNLLAETPA